MDFKQLEQTYPYLANKGINYVYTPNEKDSRILEFFPPQETGAGEYLRPKELPLGQPGIQVIQGKATPLDILGDYVSHYGVQKDPVLKELYSEFTNSLSDTELKNRYNYHKEQFNEKRPFSTWKQQTGIPELFRGYTFNQWENPEELYTPKQLQILDKVKSYIGIAPKEQVVSPFYTDPMGNTI